MARLSYVALGMLAGFAIGTAVAVSHADPAEVEVEAAAAQANVSLTDLQGAVNTTGMDPFDYLRAVGDLPPLEKTHDPPLRLVANPPPAPPSSALAECLIRAESKGNPSAVNPRSGAAGLGQFLRSTWATTPQGKAGLSVFDPVANRAAVNWMISVGRAGEFSTLGLCR